MDAADRWIALTDGGNGLEHFIDVNFPRAEKILDLQHASDYVNNFAKAYRPKEAGEKLAETWCHQLKHEGGSRAAHTEPGDPHLNGDPLPRPSTDYVRRFPKPKGSPDGNGHHRRPPGHTP
jgi:hypothetical protein